MTISDGRTKQLDIFCRVTGYKSDFLSFIVAKLIRFFHGALQLCTNLNNFRKIAAQENIQQRKITLACYTYCCAYITMCNINADTDNCCGFQKRS